MRGLFPLAVALASFGCSAKTLIVDRALAPGDAVALVLGPIGELSATIAVADDRGVATLESDQPLRAAIAIERARVRDIRGEPLSLAGIGADLAGDLEGACGCSAIDLGAGLVAGPGERCPLLPSADDFLDESVDRADLAARLRVSFPGDCACRPQRTRDVDLEVCAVGVGAERVEPLASALATDGTITLVSRALAVEIAPDGTRYETKLVPALGQIRDVVALPGGGAIALSLELTSSISKNEFRYTHIPRRGSGPAERTDRLTPPDWNISISPSPSGTHFWLHGEGTLGLTPEIQRCRAGATPERIACEDIPIVAAADCPQFASGEPVTALAELDDGTAVAAIDQGLIFIRDQQVICVPGTDRLNVTDEAGGELLNPRIYSLTAVGRRLLACAYLPDNSGLIVTATVGAIGGGALPRVTWTRVRHSLGGGCEGSGFFDAIHERAVLKTGLADFAAYADRVEEHPKGVLYPGAYDFMDGAGTATATLVTSHDGEAWVYTRSAAEPRKVVSFSRPFGFREARAILPVDGGFRLYTGAASPVDVDTEDACAGPLALGGDAFTPRDGDYDDAVVRLGDRVLLFGARAEAPKLLVLEADGRASTTLDLPARVERAVELVPGRWAVMLLADGSLHATDGVTLGALGAGARWARLDAAHGVGWAATETSFARLTAAVDGRVLLERAEIDTSRFDEDGRRRPARLMSLRAMCGGRALVGFDEELTSTIPGQINNASVWWIEALDGRFTMLRYDEFKEQRSRPFIGQLISTITGSDEAPLLVYSGNRGGAGLHAPGVPSGALPMTHVPGFAQSGSDVLIGGRNLRMSIVRVRDQGM